MLTENFRGKESLTSEATTTTGVWPSMAGAQPHSYANAHHFLSSSHRLDRALTWAENYAKDLRPRQIKITAPWVQADIDFVDAVCRKRQTQTRIRGHKRRALEVAAEGSFTHAEWEDVVRRYDGRCAYCNRRRPLEQEHVIPLSRGGSNYISNIVPACKPCNSKKWARLPEEVRW